MPDVHIIADAPSLRALQKALRDINPALVKSLRSELKDAAGIVAIAAKARVPTTSRRGKNRSGSGRHAATSIGSGATGRGAFVKGGGPSVPYYGWLDFGTRTPISGRPRSVGPWAGSGTGPPKGRFIYPALADKFDAVVDAVEKAVNKSIKEAGF